jgi:hypothetical protein
MTSIYASLKRHCTTIHREEETETVKTRTMKFWLSMAKQQGHSGGGVLSVGDSESMGSEGATPVPPQLEQSTRDNENIEPSGVVP